MLALLGSVMSCIYTYNAYFYNNKSINPTLYNRWDSSEPNNVTCHARPQIGGAYINLLVVRNDAGVGVTKQISSVPFFDYNLYIWRVSPHLSCNDPLWNINVIQRI